MPALGERLTHAIEELPVLGVGASLSLEARPDPAALVRKAGGPSFIEYAGRLDVDEVRADVQRVRAAGAPVLFHPSYINFCGSFPNDPAWLAETARHIEAVGSPWFAQDCAYCFWQGSYGYSTQFGYFIPPILNQASLERAVERVREVQAAVPVPVAIEPPPMSFAVGSMPLFGFFGSLARETECALLLDVGHLVSYELASKQKLTETLSLLPRERVIELHIAGGRIEREGEHQVYVDAHERDILPAAWDMLERLLPELPCVKAVCFECEGASEAQVLETLKRLRQMVHDRSVSPALVEVVERAS